MGEITRPIAEFYRWIEEARAPQRAERSAMGTLPVRAAQYCDAVTSASAYGWWVFPPVDITILWDGTDIHWQHHQSGEWITLQDSLQFPGFTTRFDDAAPAALRGCAPPFLSALPEPGVLQIWTGLLARTRADWSLLIRAPANVPAHGSVTVFEGIVETDRWFGPIFTNIRFTRSHKPIRLRADYPLLQLQPVPRVAYDAETIEAMTFVSDVKQMRPVDWQEYATSIVVPNENPDRPYGGYAIAARKRRRSRCPYAA